MPSNSGNTSIFTEHNLNPLRKDADIARQLLESQKPNAENDLILAKGLLGTATGKEAVRRALLSTPAGREIISEEFGVTVVDRKADAKPVVVILVPTHKEPQPETGNALNRLIQAIKRIACFRQCA